MNARVCHVRWLAVALLVVAGCGKKGPPLAPLQRIPAAPTAFSAVRIGDDVFVQLTVPVSNVDGVRPADVARVDVYAITAEREPLGVDIDDLTRVATLLEREPVPPVLPPPPPLAEGEPRPPLPVLPGTEQGAAVVIREALTAEARRAVALPDDDVRAQPPEEPTVVPRALMPPLELLGPKRYYFAAAISPRGRVGPPTPFAAVPLGAPSGAPREPVIDVQESSFTLRWTPAPDARGFTEPTPPELLPSRSLLPSLPATTYDVYEVSRTPPADGEVQLPVALTATPVTLAEFSQSGITLGTERCFIVRPVDVVEGIHVRGPASPMVCAPFADTFPPSAPANLVAVATPGLISLIWESAPSADVAGYLVLRAEAGGATLTPLMEQPITGTTYRDDAVTPGVRYVYAVVAIDRAGNRSAESNRQEETAR